jgi:AraC-like DNA-binding protein
MMSVINLSSPSTLHINVSVRHAVPTFTVKNDALIWVRRGEKRLFDGVNHIKVAAGSVTLLPRNTAWSLVNDPLMEGVYAADALEFGDSALSLFYEKHARDFSSSTVKPGVMFAVDLQLSEALADCFESQRSSNCSNRLKVHKVIEILILLAERGYVFVPRTTLNLKEQVVRLVANTPHGDWSINKIAKTLHISESTLQRKISSFGITVHALINEVRLDFALSLLQSTDLPIGEISRRCGYESHSRFTAAFRQHFGYAPSYLRSAIARDEKTEIEQKLNEFAQSTFPVQVIIESPFTKEKSHDSHTFPP